MNNDLISREALKKHKVYVEERHEYVVPVYNIDNAPTVEIPENAINCVLTMFGNCSYNETGCSDCEIKDKIRKALNERPTKVLEEPEQGKFECRIKIKDLISMLLEFDMNEKATICTTDEYNENNIVISITDMRGKEE